MSTSNFNDTSPTSSSLTSENKECSNWSNGSNSQEGSVVSENLDNKGEDDGEGKDGDVTEIVTSMYLPILSTLLRAIWHSCRIVGNLCQDIASKIFKLLGWLKIRTTICWIIAGVVVCAAFLYGLAMLRSFLSDIILNVSRTTLAYLFGFAYKPVPYLTWVTNSIFAALCSITSKLPWLGSPFSSSTPLLQNASIPITNIAEPIRDSLWQTRSSFVWLSGMTIGNFHPIMAALTITQQRIDTASSMVRASGFESNEKLASAYDDVSESFGQLTEGIGDFVFSIRNAILDAKVQVIGTQWTLESMGVRNLERIGEASWLSLFLQSGDGGRVCANPTVQEFLWAGSHWPEVGAAAVALQFYCVQVDEGREQRHEQVMRITTEFKANLLQVRATFAGILKLAEENIKTAGQLRANMKLAEGLRYKSSNTEAERLAYLQMKEADLKGVPWWMLWKEDKLKDDQLRDMARIDINLATLNEVWSLEAQATTHLLAVKSYVKKSYDEMSLLIKQAQLGVSKMSQISDKELLLLYDNLGGMLLDQLEALEGLSASIDLSNKKGWERLHKMIKECSSLPLIEWEECILRGLWLGQRIGDGDEKRNDWSFKAIE
jgi:hypothetical protein